MYCPLVAFLLLLLFSPSTASTAPNLLREANTLVGGPGNDRLDANDDLNLLYGGAGEDQLVAAGYFTFIFTDDPMNPTIQEADTVELLTNYLKTGAALTGEPSIVIGDFQPGLDKLKVIDLVCDEDHEFTFEQWIDDHPVFGTTLLIAVREAQSLEMALAFPGLNAPLSADDFIDDCN